MRNRKCQKNHKKIQKIKKYQYEYNYIQNRLEKDEKARNKNYHSVPFLSYSTRNRKFQKYRKKFKKLKNTIVASLQAKIGWRKPRKSENKNYGSVSFLPET